MRTSDADGAAGAYLTRPPAILAALFWLALCPWFRVAGAGAQAEPGKEPEAAKYRRQLGSEAAKERAEAANRLGHLGAREAIPELLRLLDDPDGQVRYFAIGALLEVGAEQAASDIAAFLNDPAPNTRLMAADALLAFGDRKLLPGVLELLERDSPRVRVLLAQRLVLSGAEEAAPVLEKLLAEAEKEYRPAYLLALGNLEHKASQARLEAFLDDPDAETRQAALLAAALIDPRKYAPRLRDLLGVPGSQEAARQILARIRDPEAWKVIYGDGANLAPEAMGCANFYSAPELCEKLRRTRFPVYELWHAPLPEVLEKVGKRAGAAVVLAGSVGPELRQARFGPNLALLGPRPDALSVLSALNGYFLAGVKPAAKLCWIAEVSGIRIASPEEAAAFWKAFDAKRGQGQPAER